MASIGVVSHTLASAVADDATVAIAYPTGLSRTDLLGSVGGDLTVGDGKYGAWEQADPGFEVTTYGASTITITNRSGISWPAGEVIRVSFGTQPYNASYNLTAGANPGQAAPAKPINLELLASGAVPAGTEVIELNHASVVIAATYTVVPNSYLIIKDTSASGTAAHTVTLTGGTFNGTNTVATLNARDEMLFVYFDSAGRGQVIANVGSVALS